ncbi:hypothetical protein P5673_001455 [Acropora cervicornis]|uniref:Uncharacterized protein n=1 Tax=Acropora cervicornis TaxID=6130 RepID=A0AAD9R641_ACRCE|nr:hypothetical protein P5673_001455 [Acropora cervicornis]
MAGDGSNDSVRPSTMTHSTKELIKDFANYTTTHGVGRLSEAKTVFSRLVWSIFILCALGMFIFQTILEIEHLFEDMLIGKLATENTSTLFNMGHQFQDFVFDCNFKGSDCR